VLVDAFRVHRKRLVHTCRRANCVGRPFAACKRLNRWCEQERVGEGGIAHKEVAQGREGAGHETRGEVCVVGEEREQGGFVEVRMLN